MTWRDLFARLFPAPVPMVVIAEGGAGHPPDAPETPANKGRLPGAGTLVLTVGEGAEADPPNLPRSAAPADPSSDPTDIASLGAVVRELGLGAEVAQARHELRPDRYPPAMPVTTPGMQGAMEGKTPLVAPDLLRRLGWHDPQGYAVAMDAACRTYGIATRARLAAFLAQVGHESGMGRWTAEIWGPTAAQKRYEGRRDLGNVQAGDGFRFRGRGLIQITGRANYTAAAKALGRSLEALPAWLESREGAIASAAWWWADHGCNGLADGGDFEALTRRINGGTNGLAERRALLAKALAALA